jgi:hypothetical protein
MRTALPLLLLWVASAPAQVITPPPPPAAEMAPPVYYLNKREFSMPVLVPPGGKVIQVTLFVSKNDGVSFRKVDSGDADTKGFAFKAEDDGLYIFALQTESNKGERVPRDVADDKKEWVRVFVDTKPPVVKLRAIAAKPGEAAIEWDVRDENLDPKNIQLEWLPPDNKDGKYQSLKAEPAARGQLSWAAPPGKYAVRLRAADLARNTTTQEITVQVGERKD